MRGLGQGKGRASIRPIGEAVFRALRGLGESAGDMRFVRLAVECRDLLLYCVEPPDLSPTARDRRRRKQLVFDLPLV